MPLYEYRCENCGELFEVMQKFSDAPLTTHEKCGGKVERLLSAPALQFKGSGWYITDYARGASSGTKNGGAAKTEGTTTSGSSDAGTSTTSSDKPSKSSDTKTKP